jgi:hypothetical protein
MNTGVQPFESQVRFLDPAPFQTFADRARPSEINDLANSGGLQQPQNVRVFAKVSPKFSRCSVRLQPRKFRHARLALQLAAQAIEHQPLSAAHFAKSALQLVGTQDQAA